LRKVGVQFEDVADIDDEEEGRWILFGGQAAGVTVGLSVGF
jgi:hypothetical protein